jgi:Kef-type K+ transport system membrane component KefB
LLIGLAAIWAAAKIGGEFFERLGQPAVLGELIAGIVLGNLVLVGFGGIEPLKNDAVISALAEIGVIILLFEVGLETNIGEMIEVGWSSLTVAILGVVVPFVLGWGVAAYFTPEEGTLGHVFIGATLCATSVGITARVLKDLGRINDRESRIILGAAVIDDVLGLLVLAVVSGLIRAASSGVAVSVTGFIGIALKAILFLAGAILIGQLVVPRLYVGLGRFRSRGVLITLSLAFCFILAWAADKAGLAPIIGAFAAGVLLDETHIEPFTRRGERDLHDLLVPISSVLVPIFFVVMGLKVDLRELVRPELMGFALTLTLAAFVGKQICSLGVLERGLNRLAVGLGMVPRGEVGLIFAGIGSTLVVRNALGVEEPVISSSTFSAIVIMVILTTLVTPPALKWAMGRKRKHPPSVEQKAS